MFDEIKEVKTEKLKMSKKGFQITVKNLDTGEVLIDSKTRAVIGAYEEGVERGAISVNGIVVTSCNTQTLMATIKGAESAVRETKKKVIEGLPPELLLAALFSDNLE